MSKETLEISVNVDEQFDVEFNLVEGLFGFILRIFGR
ncbi:MAG: phenylalanyl-tRNA synthetase subunit alpha [Bacteroidia bacterium]